MTDDATASTDAAQTAGPADGATSTQEQRRHDGGRSDPPNAWGVVPAYEDAFGTWTEVPAASMDAIVAAMGGDPTNPAAGPVDTTARPARPTPRTDGALTCVDPPGERVWGLAVQVYAARSTRSWGIGDLRDLRTVAAWAAGRGAATVLINPIDAVAPVTPRETSPYTPTSRRFLDPVYLCVDEVPRADQVGLSDLRARGLALDDQRRIDRDAVWALKQQALRRIWELPATREDPELAAFRDDRGDELRWWGAYCAIVAEHGPDTRTWPDELGDPTAPGVETYAASDEAAFATWQQFLLDRQLAAANDACPLLRDLPIGFDPAGFDGWQWRDLLADGVTVGAPPDPLGPRGQDWGLPAFVPWKLAQADLAPLRATYDAAMRNAGGLRIDHVLGLFRLFWIPPAGTAAEGAYVRQASEVQLDVVAAASRDAGTWVVGEDLGTVERGVRPTLRDRRMLRYQVLWFEPDPPDDWDELALASLSTHDLPTVAGTWTGRDADIAEEAGLERTDQWLARLRTRLADDAGIDADAPLDEALVALHAHVAAGPSRIVLGQLDDLLGVVERPNVPGTDRHLRPDNWSLALPHPVDRLDEHPLAPRVADALRRVDR